jgi:hypothetical protein
MGKIPADRDPRARVGHASALGPPTRAQVDARAHELAVLAGRVPPYVTQSDYQQAKRELTGETDLDRQNAMLDGPSTFLAAAPR